MDASLRLGYRHALYAMRAAFVLEPAPGAWTLDNEDDLVESAVIRIRPRQNPDFPAVLLGVAGEQVRLLASFGTADLHDHVAPVVRVLRNQKIAQFDLDRGDRLFCCGQLVADDVAVR